MLPRDIWVHHPDALQRQARACGGVRAGPSGGAPPPWAQQPGCRRRPTVTCLRMPVPWCVPLRASTAGPHPPCCPCCPPPPPLPQVLDQWRVRVVSWIGDWVCPCERTHFMRINCPDCGYSAPCRWVLQQGSYLPGGGGGGGSLHAFPLHTLQLSLAALGSASAGWRRGAGGGRRPAGASTCSLLLALQATMRADTHLASPSPCLSTTAQRLAAGQLPAARRQALPLPPPALCAASWQAAPRGRARCERAPRHAAVDRRAHHTGAAAAAVGLSGRHRGGGCAPAHRRRRRGWSGRPLNRQLPPGPAGRRASDHCGGAGGAAWRHASGAHAGGWVGDCGAGGQGRGSTWAGLLQNNSTEEEAGSPLLPPCRPSARATRAGDASTLCCCPARLCCRDSAAVDRTQLAGCPAGSLTSLPTGLQLLDPEDLAMALEQMQEAEAARVQQQGTTEQQQEQQRQEQARQRQWQQQQQQQAQGAQHGDGMRIVSSSARWVCGCGQLNRATRGPTCTHSGCSQLGPCRWVGQAG